MRVSLTLFNTIQTKVFALAANARFIKLKENLVLKRESGHGGENRSHLIQAESDSSC